MTYDADSYSASDIPLKNSHRLVLLGGRKVGKTCVGNWFLNKVFEECYIPTVENFYKEIFKIRGEMYSLEILDTSGNDPFPAIKKLNIMTGDIFVLVFSLTDINSYIQVKTLCEEIKELKKTKNLDKKVLSTNILILGNKLDQVMDARNKKVQLQTRCIDPIDAQNFALTYKSCFYSEISCKTDWGVSTAFHDFFEKCHFPIELLPTKHRRLDFDENFDQKPFFTRGYFSKSRVNHVSRDVTNKTDGEAKSKRPLSRHGVENSSLRKSFKKLTFQKQFNESYGKVLVNFRRPSIRSEMKLCELKADISKKGQYSVSRNGNRSQEGTKDKMHNIFESFRGLFRRNTINY